MTRAAEIEAFLAAAGWQDARRQPLAGDASARRYTRLFRGSARAMLMDLAPGSGLHLAPFLAVTDWLRGLGLSAPEILASDSGTGLALVEDLGEDLFARLAAVPGTEAEIYAAAIDVIADLSTRLPAATPDWTPPPYDDAVLSREMRLVSEWYLPAVTGAPTPPDMAAEYEAACRPILVLAATGGPAPVLRDYHAENLLWLPARRGPARVGLLDYQDLLIGHPAYDVVSLVADARRDLAPGLRDALTERYLARTGFHRAEFLRAAQALSAQRNLKILGLFLRLARRDGKTAYLRHLPRVWRHLRADLAHPDLAGLAAFVARHIPPPDRLAAA